MQLVALLDSWYSIQLFTKMPAQAKRRCRSSLSDVMGVLVSEAPLSSTTLIYITEITKRLVESGRRGLDANGKQTIGSGSHEATGITVKV